MVGRLWERTVAENLYTQIRDNAAGPKKANGDSGSIEQHSIADQIAADRICALVSGNWKVYHSGKWKVYHLMRC
jgi:hypothetical protein